MLVVLVECEWLDSEYQMVKWSTRGDRKPPHSDSESRSCAFHGKAEVNVSVCTAWHSFMIHLNYF